MKYEIMEGLVKLMKDRLMTSDTIKKATILNYMQTLKDFPDALVIDRVDFVCKIWEGAKIPKPGTIYKMCIEKYEKDQAQEKVENKENLKRQEREWQSRKFRNQKTLKDVITAIRDDKLTETQKKNVNIVGRYMVYSFGDRWMNKISYEDHNQKLDPITASFVGLYMDAAAGKLKPLTGKKVGSFSTGNSFV